ncbi:MAG: terminase [Azospirillum brasilense]|nr:MAG: terminase [Azospirillum brasilense]
MARPATRRRSAPPIERAKLSAPQMEIYRAGWTPRARFRAVVAGRRFGKSFLSVEEVRRAAREAVRQNVSPDNEIWYAAPTFRQGKRVMWKRLKRGIPESWLAAKANETECSLTLVSGHVIRIVGLDNYDALRGSGLWFVVVDEWADCPYLAWTETLRPMLSTAGGHALWIGTPKGFDHLRDSYLAGQPGGEPDHMSFMYTTVQGGNVPPDELEAARRTLDERTYRQEYEASFETYSGRVIYAFSRAGSCRDAVYDPALPLHVGMDFNIDPMTAIILQEQGGVDVVVDEVIIPTSNTDDMCDELTRRYGRGGSVAHVTVYPDPAGAQRRTSAQGRTDIGILQGRGFKVLAMSSHPLVRDRVNTLNSRFCTADGVRRMFVSPKCRKTIDALERLQYKEGTSEPDKASGYDHAVDALSYFAHAKHAYRPPRMATVPGLFQR